MLPLNLGAQLLDPWAQCSSLESDSVQFGQYELVKRIARGGMAEIFLAIERGFQGVTRQVVIKRVLPQMLESDDFITMFMDEARLVARLGHPNIAHVYGFGEIDDLYYLTMEYVDGLTLAKLMRVMRDRRVPLPVTLRLMADACAGLHFAHEVKDEEGRHLGVVHRDISPQNIMVSRAGVAKLIDFGVAQAATQAHVTAAGQLKGKLAYMSPEQFRGKGVDRRADLFAIGAVLHEMITGERLFLRENEAATMHALMFDEPPSVQPFGAPPELDLIIKKAVQKSPVERFKTALECQQALEALIAQNNLVVSTFQVGQFIEAAMTQIEVLRTNVRAQAEREKNVPDLTPTHVSMPSARESAPMLTPPPSLPPELSSVPSARESAPMLTPPPSLPPELSSVPPADADLLVTTPGILAGPGAPKGSQTPSFVAPSPASNVEGKSSRRGLIIGLVAILLLLVGGGVIGLWFAFGSGDGSTAVTIAEGGAEDGGSLQAEVDFDFASSALDQQPDPRPIPIPIEGIIDSGPPPDAADAASGGSPDAGDSGSGAATPTKARPARGTLFVNTTPWSKVRLGGRSLGITPIVGVSVPAGTHRLVLTDPTGTNHTRRITIRPRQPTKLFVNLRRSPSL